MAANRTKVANQASEPSVVPRQSLSSRYELLGRLGSGGMAEIFLARATGISEFEKVVVLKRILSNKRSDPYFAGMLRDEARVAAFLSHPNIVQTHDIALDGDDYFFTMEYLHGETVKKLVYRSRTIGIPIPLELVLQIGIGAAAGLHHAHEQTDYEGRPLGIVHRDVSPSNVIVTRQSGVKLIDFGIAKAASGKEETAVGTVKGKAAYMAPEQCRGTGVDRRSDVFSLGIVLYEMVTQQKPFDGPNELATLHMLLSTDPAPATQVRPDCPVELELIIARAMKKDPAERYQTVFEMQEELELVMRDLQLHALPGALGRFLNHLFGAKPHPWTQRAPKPPPVPRWAWADMDNTVTARRHAAAAVAAMTPTASTAPGAGMDRPGLAGPTSPATPAVTMDRSPAAPPHRVPTNETSSHSQVRPRQPSMFATFAVTAVLTSGLAAIIAAAAWPTGDDAPLAATKPTVASRQAAAPPPQGFPPAAPDVVPTVAEVDAAAPGAAPANDTAAAAGAPPNVAPTEPTTTEDATPAVVVELEPDAAEPTSPGEQSSAASAPRTARAGTRRAEAEALLKEARDIAFTDSARALKLIRKSVSLRNTTDAYSLYGTLACRQKSMRDVRKAYRVLRGSRKEQMAEICAKRGIKL